MWRRRVALAGLFVAAVALRCLLFPAVFTSQGVLPYGRDAYYHLRRILWSVDHFPAFLDHDSYLSFPHGGRAIWTPVMDWTLAALFRGIYGPDDPVAITTAAVLTPPVVGGLCVLALFAVGRRFFPEPVAWLSAGLLAILPASWLFGQLGYLDHHVFVQLASVAILGASIRFVVDCGAPTGDRGMVRAGLWLGLAWGAAVAIWPGALLHVWLSQIAVLACWLSARDLASERDAALGAMLAHGLAAGVVLPLCLRVPWTPLRPVILSGFQPVWFLAGACFFVAVAALRTRLREMRLADRFFMAAAVVGLILGVWLAASPALRASIVVAFDWLGRGEEFQALVDESLPLLSDAQGEWSGRFAFRSFSGLFLVFPFLLAFELVALRRGRSDRQRAMLLLWSSGLVLASLFQRRFTNSFSVAFCLQCGLALWLAGGWLRARWPEPRPRAVATALAIALLLVALLPVGSHYGVLGGVALARARGLETELPHFFDRDRNAIEVARWLRDASTPTSGYRDGEERPEYGVLAPWGDGHLLRYHAERPVVQDNFGDDVSPETFALAEAYFAAGTEAEALGISEALELRYVVVRRNGSGHGVSYRPRSQFTRLYRLRGTRGLVRGGGQPMLARALTRHRLIYESAPVADAPIEARPVPEYRIFEIVEGGVLEGRAEPGAVVDLHLSLTSSRTGPFWYRAQTRSDAMGRYRFRVPYATDDFSPDVAARQPYVLASGGLERLVEVPEEAVRSGARVEGPSLELAR